MYEYRARMLRVVDGDTVDFLVDLGFGTFKQIRARLTGVDTPEVYGVKKDSPEHAEGIKASEFTRLWFEMKCSDGECVIRTEKDRTGKYGRWLATVLPIASKTTGDTVSLNDAIKANGHDA